MLTSKLHRSIASLGTFDCRAIKVGERNLLTHGQQVMFADHL